VLPPDQHHHDFLELDLPIGDSLKEPERKCRPLVSLNRQLTQLIGTAERSGGSFCPAAPPPTININPEPPQWLECVYKDAVSAAQVDEDPDQVRRAVVRRLGERLGAFDKLAASIIDHRWRQRCVFAPVLHPTLSLAAANGMR
jgi:hypothetical protein